MRVSILFRLVAAPGSRRPLRSRTKEHPFQRGNRRSTVGFFLAAPIRHCGFSLFHCMRLSSWPPWPAGRPAGKGNSRPPRCGHYTLDGMEQLATGRRDAQTRTADARVFASGGAHRSSATQAAIRSARLPRPARTTPRTWVRWFRLDGDRTADRALISFSYVYRATGPRSENRLQIFFQPD